MILDGAQRVRKNRSRQKNGEGEKRGEHKRGIKDEALVIDDEK
jgi:hypothetical protein